MELVEVIIWDKLVGVLVWDDVKMSTRFEFSKAFVRENIQLSRECSINCVKLFYPITKVCI
jgi:serine/threonine-protein kinase HipA